MIPNKSKQTASLVTLKIQEFIVKKGWQVMRSEEESPYDLIIDMGLDDNGIRKFATVQVKKNLRSSSRPSPNKNSEPVSKNGKNRNSYWYYDEDVTYLATVTNQDEVLFFHKDKYLKNSPSFFKKGNDCDLPENKKMFSYRRSESKNEISSLEKFMRGG